MTDGICIDIHTRKAREPRYDDVYFNGVKWLDSLTHDPFPDWDDETDRVCIED